MNLRLSVVLAAALAGCLDMQPAAPNAPAFVPAPDDAVLATHAFEGAITGSPGSPAQETFAFNVPDGATEVRAHLAWATQGARLSLALLDPGGNEAEHGFAETPTTRALATSQPPMPGTWTAVVESERALSEAFNLQVEITTHRAQWRTIEETYVIQTRAPVREVARHQHGGFVEINLILEPGQGFNYTWTSDHEVYFNIHYHGADGNTERVLEERAGSLEGGFTAPIAEVYSLLWRNEGALPATVQVTVDGVFREHSRTR